MCSRATGLLTLRIMLPYTKPLHIRGWFVKSLGGEDFLFGGVVMNDVILPEMLS